MKVALGQFAVQPSWQANSTICQQLISQAVQQQADLIVFPEGVTAYNHQDKDSFLHSAQPLDGPFVQNLLQHSLSHSLAIVFTMAETVNEQQVRNTLLVIQQGKIINQYRKLHLYDAFSYQESKNVIAGDQLPTMLTIAGMKVGMMTCYDLRFPELARRLAMDGAEVLLYPSAWVKGELKVEHWQTLSKARALENTCYVVSVSECGERNIGCSLVVDPLGRIISQADNQPTLLFAQLDANYLQQVRQQLPVLQHSRFAKPQLLTE